MIQAFYTTAAGLMAQQKNLDVISNNLSNISTPGYRPKRAEFAEILANEAGNLTAGQGVRATVTQTPLPKSVNPLAMKISGGGYFVAEDESGRRVYTQNGDFMRVRDGGNYYLATQNGHFVLDENGNRIEVNGDLDNVAVANGRIYPDGNLAGKGIRPAIVNFNNSSALEPYVRDTYLETEESGQPVVSGNSQVHADYEAVDMIGELARFLRAQRAYQLGSRAMQVIDEVEGMTNHLRY